jgi:hypothetical protein
MFPRDAGRFRLGQRVSVRAAALVAMALLPTLALTQELEPRAYSNAPVGTSFLVGAYTRITGGVLLDPSLPVSNVDARIDVYTLAYARFIDLFGRSANFSVALPYMNADLQGDVMDAPASAHRAGLGDLRLRGAVNLFGHPALTPAEFVKRSDAFSGGASLSVIAPTGQYEPTRFINVGTNRWAFKPELGVSYPIGNWFTEAAAGVWFFTDNDNFSSGHRRSQEPLAAYQLHAGYSFRPGLWLAGDYGYYSGGRTAVDGAAKDDRQSNSRIGLALSLPIARGWSAKLAYAKGAVVRVGGDFNIASIAVQYRLP